MNHLPQWGILFIEITIYQQPDSVGVAYRSQETPMEFISSIFLYSISRLLLRSHQYLKIAWAFFSKI
jgi:hypothetical protein